MVHQIVSLELHHWILKMIFLNTNHEVFKQSNNEVNKPSTLTDKVMLVPCFTFLLLNLSRKRGGTKGSLGSVKCSIRLEFIHL